MDSNEQAIINKTDELNKLAWDVRVKDSNKALQLSEEAISLAKEVNYIRGMAEGLRTLGFSYIRMSKHTEAKQLLNDSMELFIQLNDQCGESDVNEYLGIIQRSVGDYKGSLELLYKALELRRQNGYVDGESLSLYHLGVTYKYLGNLEKALECFLQSLLIAKEINYWVSESYSLNNIGGVYFELGDYDNAVKYFEESLAIRNSTGDKWGEAGCLDNIGYSHFRKENYKLAKTFCENSLAISCDVGDKKGEANSLFHLAEINFKTNDYNIARSFADKSLRIREHIGDKKGQAELNLFLAEITLANEGDKNYNDEKLTFLNKALSLGEETKALDLLYKIHKGFYNAFKESGHYAEALAHLELFNEIEKEIHSNTINQKILNLEINHKVEQSKKETEIYRLRNVELASLYEEGKKQQQEIELQKLHLEQTIDELKATQSQLIQSEKMASLGELTAGIAHEIQNPLNFVNNFSEVNTELIAELKEEIQAGNHANVIALANDIANNEQKINHHGKRADAIVKGMLQHSRSSNGVKVPTDINALGDEYLRLAYHGLRAKDKSFNATMNTDFDATIGNIDIIPQDIGRVILNLITNAFYAALLPPLVSGGVLDPGYKHEPTVWLSTKKVGDKVFISVKDNGQGIPQKILDKIFQPFFTTKPTGQGTGLGLSLSYDIVKAHGGELKVETKEGEGAAFIIQLPYQLS